MFTWFKALSLIGRIGTIVALLLSLWAGIALVMSNHDKSVIDDFEKRVEESIKQEVIKDGKVIEQGFSNDNDRIDRSVDELLNGVRHDPQNENQPPVLGEDSIDAEGFSESGSHVGTSSGLHSLEASEESPYSEPLPQVDCQPDANLDPELSYICMGGSWVPI